MVRHPHSDRRIGAAFWCAAAVAPLGCASSSAEASVPGIEDAAAVPSADVVTGDASLQALSGDETRYLGFQIFTAGPNVWQPFDTVVDTTPKAAIAQTVQQILDTIGTRGSSKARLGFVVGPLAFDQTDVQIGQLIDDAFAIAIEKDVAVGFHIDESMFWSRRADLMSDPANVELVAWGGPKSQALKIDWAHPPARMCFNAPAIQTEVTRRARDVIGARIAAGMADLKSRAKADLFAGIILGWESHMGQDVSTSQPLGYCAMGNRGFSASGPPTDRGAEVASIVAEFLDRWADALVQAGVADQRIYSHVAFLPRAEFDKLKASDPNFPNVAYEYVLDAGTSTQRPSVAFGPHRRAGFTTYPTTGVFEQIQDELTKHAATAWASSEGTNVVPPGAATGFDMETYLAQSFNRGATLVNVFGWGIGGTVVTDNPYRVVTEAPDSLNAYRKLLDQP
jgi:hypothetical protein